MHFHFHKGLMFEIFLKIFNSNEGVLFNNHIFRNLWHYRGGPLSRPQEGIFSSTTVKNDLFLKRSWEALGKESVNQQLEMESCLQLSCMYVSTEYVLPMHEPVLLARNSAQCVYSVFNVLFPEWLDTKGNLYRSFLQIQDTSC